MVGTEIAGFRIVKRLEGHGPAELYLAERDGDPARYVLKAVTDPKLRERHERAIELLRDVEHPNLVPLAAAVSEARALYVFTPYYEAGDLGVLVERAGPLAWEVVVAIARQVGAALDELHRAGIVHRDVKPGNVLLGDPAGATAFLADPGLATRADGAGSLTQTGSWAGTPDHVAPEQIRGDLVDGRADVYALGTLVFTCLTGQVPFPRDTMVATLWAQVNDPPPALSSLRPGLPPGIDDVLFRVLAKDPDARFATCADFVAGLSAPGTVAPPPPAPELPPMESLPPMATMPVPPPPPMPASPARGGWLPKLPRLRDRGRHAPSPPPPPAPFPPPLAAPADTAAPRPAWASTTAASSPRPMAPITVVEGPMVEALDEARLAALAAGAEPSPAGPEPKGEIVDCSVFAPLAVMRGVSALVQVFLHLPEQADDAAALATEFDADAKRRGFRSLSCPVARGDVVGIELTVPGAAVDDPVQTLRWDGRATSLGFGLTVPSDFPSRSTVGTVTVSRHGLPVGHVKFKLDVLVEAGDGDLAPSPRGDEARQYRQAFVSYASADRAEVLRRVQVLSALGISYFQDVLDLEPGQRWERELYRRIDEADLFLLFWSGAARESTWVRREVDYALGRGTDDPSPPEIRPVLVEGPPVPPPWPELAHLHFDDRALYALGYAAVASAPPTAAGPPTLQLEPVVVPEAGVTVGRDGDVGRGDASASRLHAHVRTLGDGTLQIEDLGSTNGTFVNGRRIHAPTSLQPGDVIQAGATRLRVR